MGLPAEDVLFLLRVLLLLWLASFAVRVVELLAQLAVEQTYSSLSLADLYGTSNQPHVNVQLMVNTISMAAKSAAS